ncbi:MEDS domain-containing protein [Candidatus Manganitrophus noduliformans]|uniref:histidine kinase n=1 Tax=Candidatus Manganitrophus noduliformans TaxID=2606439 RepID=A0A7X6IB57_9BACT|nr:MEDS domain-containing protein [Candidatus Manganitrophus noduliformans]NKE71136.1 PAS domain S-box protein [Candidatus Manganitrophus noduliformans]
MKHPDLSNSLLVKTIEQTAPHDHLCLLYETPQEQLAAAISFIRIGLQRGERCVYLVDHNAATVTGAMRQEGIDVDAAVRSCALIIAEKQEAYLMEGYFDPDKMISFLEQTLHSSEKAGFPALRVTGEMTWALGGDPGTKRLIEYEAKLNRFFSKKNVSAICQYDRKRFSPEVLLDVIRTHPKVISGGVVCRNHYYVPPGEFFSKNGASVAFERTLNNIVDREKSEIALREGKINLELKNLQLEREIVEHRRVNERLDLYRRIVSSAYDAIAVIDSKGGYLEQNESHRRLIGYSDEALRGKTPAIHLGEESFGRIAEELVKNGIYRGEHVSRTKSGEELVIELSAFTMRNEAGEVVCHVGIKRDITGRKRMEEALNVSQNRYKGLVDSIDGIVWEVDISTYRFTFVSRQAERILGYPAARWLNEPDFWREQIHPEDREWAVAFCAKKTREMCDHDFEYRMMAADGRAVWLRDLVTVIVENGRPVMLRGVMIDVTEQKRTEEALKQKTVEAEEASRLKSHFLSNVSHELRTPLNAIIGYAHLLGEEAYGAVAAEQRPALEGIQRNAKDLSRLIGDVLDLSKIEAGKMSVDLSEVDLPALVAETAAGLRPLSEKKSLPIRCVIEPGISRIESDESKIRQVLVNLLSNAVKFTSKGEIVVHVRKGSDRQGIALAVQDTGIGIRPEQLPGIFDAFHQLDEADTREFGGVGLGLAIVKELLHLLGGEIRVESEYGKGSTFTVLLPVRN